MTPPDDDKGKPDDTDDKSKEDSPDKDDPTVEERLEAAEKDAKKWKGLSRRHEDRAKANADAATELADLKDRDKTEEQKNADRLAAAEKGTREAEEKAEKANLRALRITVGAAKGLSPTNAARLVGETEEELEADADVFVESLGGAGDKSGKKPSSSRPQTDLKPGSGGDDDDGDDDGPSDPVKLAESVPRV